MHEVSVWLVFIDPRICESDKVGLPSYLRKKTIGLSVFLARNEHIGDRAGHRSPFHSKRECLGGYITTKWEQDLDLFLNSVLSFCQTHSVSIENQ